MTSMPAAKLRFMNLNHKVSQQKHVNALHNPKVMPLCNSSKFLIEELFVTKRIKKMTFLATLLNGLTLAEIKYANELNI